MNSTSSLIITALLLVVAAVVIGCESDQKTNTAPSVVTVGTVYANMTATANSDQTTNLAPIPATPSGARSGPVYYATSTSLPSWAITSGNSATASARAEALRGADRNKVPSCFPNCPTPVPTAPLPTPLPTLATIQLRTPEEIALSILATSAANNPKPTPTVVMRTDPGTHAGINANEAIALVKDYLWKKPYPGDTRVYQGMTCGEIWDQAYNWNGTTTWTARKFGDSA